MANAKGARTCFVLGASLVAVLATSPGFAAIHGSGSAGIHGSGMEAIDGSGVEAIHGSGIYAIHGSGAEAIHGSGAEAIHGSGIYAIDGSGAEALRVSNTENFVLFGPVTSIDINAGVFKSLGQTVIGRFDTLRDINVGDLVAVHGSIKSAGWIDAKRLIVSPDQYVPGASEIFVTGIPSYVDYATGQARIGGLTIDYTPSLGADQFGGIGAAISVYGTQPAPGGLMLSERVIDQSDLFFKY